MQAWRRQFSQGNWECDLASTCFMLIIIICSFLCAVKNSATPLTEWLPSIFGLSQYLGIAFIILCYRNFYIKWRSQIIVPHMISSLIIYYTRNVMCPQFLIFHPLEMPHHPIKGLLHLLFIPGVLLKHSVTYILPVSIFKPLSFLRVALVWKGNAFRCHLEIASVPGQGSRYRALADGMEKLFYRWLPPSVNPQFDHFGVSQLTDEEVCMLVDITLQVVLGVLFPLAILSVAEILSRRDLEIRMGREDMFFLVNKPAVLLVYNILLIPFQTTVAFHFFVVVLRWGHILGLG